ncbi:Aste57867_23575 [Aphanomyces stellatus]|uniref:Aste57867_23575 protein n=1 Tax=Aphanomyces stellatus TaxID=120398 RepID=A0A485LN68_9STRA|nr:hypothetical protein As57867_023504 [Aphanomyces stellatus]VFU00220.1 Aste57867_23575 [Aphanomyces stellatus]
MSDLDAVYSSASRKAHFDKVHMARLRNGLHMEYALHGRDSAPEKVLLIVGFQGLKEEWLPLISTLLPPNNLTTAAQYQLVSFDNRGVGGTDKPWGLYSTTQMALDAVQLMDHLQWSSAHVVGASLGGMIAQELAYIAPERVKSLVLMVTTPGFMQSLLSFDQWSGYWALFKKALSGTPVAALLHVFYPEEYLGELLRGDISVGMVLYSHHVDTFKVSQLHMSGFLGQYAAVLRHRMTPDRLARIRAHGFPIAVVAAKKDRVIHSDNSKILYAWLKGNNTHAIVFEDSGHGVVLQHRQQIAQALRNHFESCYSVKSRL